VALSIVGHSTIFKQWVLSFFSMGSTDLSFTEVYLFRLIILAPPPIG
jgi:hypothetical protein